MVLEDLGVLEILAEPPLLPMGACHAGTGVRRVTVQFLPNA